MIFVHIPGEATSFGWKAILKVTKLELDIFHAKKSRQIAFVTF